MDEFDQFWEAYPRRVSKGDARRAWIQTATIRPPITELLEAVERGKASVAWHRADREGIIGAFIPYPASWLRAEGWANEYTVRLPAVGSSKARAEPEQPAQLPTEAQKEEARRLLAQFKLKGMA